MKPSFYFAHPVTMYGTPAERQIMAAFQRTHPGVGVENPDQPQHSEGYKREGMDYFVRLCDSQDGVFFATFADGTVGAGVAKEVGSFLDRGAPTLYYDPQGGDFVEIHDRKALEEMRVLDVDDSRARLKEERRLKEAGQDPYESLDRFAESVRGARVNLVA